MIPDIDTIQARWARLGALFNVKPSSRTPDIECLLLDTARVIPQRARLFAMSASWLVHYHRLVCRHRLAALVDTLHEPATSATIGYLLSTVRHCTHTDHLNLVLKRCEPLGTPMPLYDAYRRSSALTAIAKDMCDPLAQPWGLFAPPERLYDDALRPGNWIMRHNPSLRRRALFNGQLAASILVTLEADPATGQSESALARACGATRCAVRDALDHLELCQFIVRNRVGNTAPILLCG
jgi:hypothetical protein